MNDGPILYAEDDPHDIFFLKRSLGDAQIMNPLQIARDGQEAIDYLGATGNFAGSALPCPCLVLLDLKMPHKNGFEVLEWMRSQPRLRCVPVIILTGSAQHEDMERAYLLGANSYLIKPLDMQSRFKMAQLIRDYWLRLNQSG